MDLGLGRGGSGGQALCVHAVKGALQMQKRQKIVQVGPGGRARWEENLRFDNVPMDGTVGENEIKKHIHTYRQAQAQAYRRRRSRKQNTVRHSQSARREEATKWSLKDRHGGTNRASMWKGTVG